MTTALITGACGFVGRALARRLRAEPGVALWGAGRRPGPAGACSLDRYRALDVADPDAVARLVRESRPDQIFHLAGRSSGTPVEIARTNVRGTVALLDAVRVHAPGARVVVAGSAAEYGPVGAGELPIRETQPCRPAGPYAETKHAASVAAIACARHHGMKVAVARPFNLVGPGLPPAYVLGAILERARAALRPGGGTTVKVGNLDAVRDFLSVEDAVEGLVALSRAGPWGEAFNLCSGRPMRIREAVELLLSRSETPLRLEVDESLRRPSEPAVSYGSWEKAREAFGFHPRTALEDALAAAWSAAMKDAA